MKDRASLWSAQGQLSLAPLAPMESTQERAFSLEQSATYFWWLWRQGYTRFHSEHGS
uniref:Uncharacterized protein n=1 Tax=uncultured actinobacterium HF0200_20K23 TaxID=711001 RepID=E0XUG2_9ACTN|nr:hypothetical protein [uncultured actinobacterium HF0200_20K23]